MYAKQETATEMELNPFPKGEPKTVKVELQTYKRLAKRAHWGRPLSEAIEELLNIADYFDSKQTAKNDNDNDKKGARSE